MSGHPRWQDLKAARVAEFQRQLANFARHFPDADEREPLIHAQAVRWRAWRPWRRRGWELLVSKGSGQNVGTTQCRSGRDAEEMVRDLAANVLDVHPWAFMVQVEFPGGRVVDYDIPIKHRRSEL